MKKEEEMRTLYYSGALFGTGLFGIILSVMNIITLIITSKQGWIIYLIPLGIGLIIVFTAGKLRFLNKSKQEVKK